ncbi:right-handed parallel beta-helix repeat-containing protein [Agrilutibacter solisilvae]|uniref:Right-handed parallel beta-helix repeat-containing protein n=1 Tax=Agrilutibacter solisilvae TaxID=2763317 RepID=A0A974Y1W4_9GAMM|nr:right-handed parallel beta-helix repeat-containing protein [Lysobacter solisilvae]QSX79070.1 right-handed parallel beta-helix repeat-containing protein [Lysobacter solisilvae]
MFRAVLLAAIALAVLPHAARAAESYDNCAGTVTSLPASIGASGVWCMKSDLSTAMTSGVAVTITANNVTLDCNHFRLGGLAAGLTTMAVGIQASGRSNVTLRHCNVRGFLYGAQLNGGSGNLIEDNRFDNSTYVGISVSGDSFTIRRNMVMQTGLTPHYDYVRGILSSGSAGVIEQNLVSGVAPNTQVYSFGAGTGIDVGSSYTVVRQNDVTGVYSGTDSGVIGIAGSGAKGKLLGNTVSALNSPSGTRRGLNCTGAPSTVAVGNVISDASSSNAIYACLDGGHNVEH